MKSKKPSYQLKLVVLCEQLEDADKAGDEEATAQFVNRIIETVREQIEVEK